MFYFLVNYFYSLIFSMESEIACIKEIAKNILDSCRVSKRTYIPILNNFFKHLKIVLRKLLLQSVYDRNFLQ
jgi:hypothetical protein